MAELAFSPAPISDDDREPDNNNDGKKIQIFIILYACVFGRKFAPWTKKKEKSSLIAEACSEKRIGRFFRRIEMPRFSSGRMFDYSNLNFCRCRFVSWNRFIFL